MAEDDASAPQRRAVLALVMDCLNVTNARQLADALGMTDIDRERRARRWVNGENAPNFDFTMLMLSKAGLLTAEADRAWTGLGPDAQAQAQAAVAAAREAEEKLESRDPATRARRGRGTG